MPTPDHDVVLLRTPSQLDADMLAAALDDAGIPYYRRIETPTGLRLTPAEGVIGVFGNCAIIVVPASAREEAREILESLPIDPDSANTARSRPTSPAAMAIARVLVIFLLGSMVVAVLGLVIVGVFF